MTNQGNTVNTSYNYNPRSEVVGANHYTLNQVFSYDNIGNCVIAKNNNFVTNYTTHNHNQYTTKNEFNPLFEDDDNQTRIKILKDVFDMMYNGENRPVKFKNTFNSSSVLMSYDYQGRRVKKTSYNGLGECLETALFFYKAYTLIEDTTNNNEVLNEFIWDSTAGEATRPLYIKTQSAYLLYFHDANKNMLELVYKATPNGIGAHYEYDPFGNTTVSTRNTPQTTSNIRTLNPVRFSSEYYDSELDLIDYNDCPYNPLNGRWLSRAPIEENGGYNLYSMANNNLLNNYDLRGNGRVDEWNDLMDELSNKIVAGVKGSNDFVLKLAIYREAFDNFKNKVTDQYPEIEQFMDLIEDMKANEIGINCPADKHVNVVVNSR